MNNVSITKVFKYRCFEPVEGLALFDEALDNRHTLWNKLVEIDRDFREKSSQIITPIQSDYQVLDQEIKNLQDSIKAIKRKTRSTAKEETRNIQDTIKELKVKRKEAYQEFKRLKHEFDGKTIAFNDPQKRTLGITEFDDIYTNLGLLLSDQCPHELKIAVFQGTDGYIFRDRREIRGALLDQLYEAYEYIDNRNAVKATI